MTTQQDKVPNPKLGPLELANFSYHVMSGGVG